MRRSWLRLAAVLFVWVTPGVSAAPEMTEAQRAVLADNASDGELPLDAGPALYALLENAAGWDAGDFAGERGAATPATPDFAFLAEQPGEVRGDVFLIEGRFIEQVRYPTQDRDGRDHLSRTRWGDQLTAWGIKVGEGQNDVVMVYFVDPDGAIAPPKNGQRVRVAARFYNVWSVQNREGEPLEFLTFVGGGREVVGGGGTGGGPMWNKAILLAVVVVAGGYYGMRVFLSRKASAGRAHSQAMLDQRRRERGHDADDGEEEEIDPDLPDDPAEALAYLQAKEDGEV
ncbi:MAG: hypothetical protein ACIAXF_13795 [Phycisphaerales bacterium JB063]